jgi:hypothetical protein
MGIKAVAKFFVLIFAAGLASFFLMPRAPHCLIIGDSIAAALSERMPECRANAQSGISSQAVIARVAEVKTLIVSAGTNDQPGEGLAENLRAIRARATNRVIWILPANPMLAAKVDEIARENQDIELTFVARDDGIHPGSYDRMIKSVRLEMRWQIF